jgi:hypothetical protein
MAIARTFRAQGGEVDRARVRPKAWVVEYCLIAKCPWIWAVRGVLACMVIRCNTLVCIVFLETVKLNPKLPFYEMLNFHLYVGTKNHVHL